MLDNRVNAWLKSCHDPYLIAELARQFREDSEASVLAFRHCRGGDFWKNEDVNTAFAVRNNCTIAVCRRKQSGSSAAIEGDGHDAVVCYGAER